MLVGPFPFIKVYFGNIYIGETLGSNITYGDIPSIGDLLQIAIDNNVIQVDDMLPEDIMKRLNLIPSDKMSESFKIV